MDDRVRRALFAVFLGVLAACSAAPARAQAWLPPKGEAWLSLGYGNLYHTKHYLGLADPDGTTEVDVGHTRVQSIGLQLGYGITDRLAMSVALLSYLGSTREPSPTESTASSPRTTTAATMGPFRTIGSISPTSSSMDRSRFLRS
jgi:hypothetical protein